MIRTTTTIASATTTTWKQTTTVIYWEPWSTTIMTITTTITGTQSSPGNQKTTTEIMKTTMVLPGQVKTTKVDSWKSRIVSIRILNAEQASTHHQCPSSRWSQHPVAASHIAGHQRGRCLAAPLSLELVRETMCLWWHSSYCIHIHAHTHSCTWTTWWSPVQHKWAGLEEWRCQSWCNLTANKKVQALSKGSSSGHGCLQCSAVALCGPQVFTY